MELINVYELWDRFENSSLTEFTMEHQGTQICFKRSVKENVANPEIKTLVAENRKPEQVSLTEEKEIKSPLVGTFYSAPTPDSQPFVSKGQKIEKGQVIGIIEAMKLMNEVTATEDGEISDVLVENGSLVEYNQVLLKLK